MSRWRPGPARLRFCLGTSALLAAVAIATAGSAAAKPDHAAGHANHSGTSAHRPQVSAAHGHGQNHAASAAHGHGRNHAAGHAKSKAHQPKLHAPKAHVPPGHVQGNSAPAHAAPQPKAVSRRAQAQAKSQAQDDRAAAHAAQQAAKTAAHAAQKAAKAAAKQARQLAKQDPAPTRPKSTHPAHKPIPAGPAAPGHTKHPGRAHGSAPAKASTATVGTGGAQGLTGGAGFAGSNLGTPAAAGRPSGPAPHPRDPKPAHRPAKDPAPAAPQRHTVEPPLAGLNRIVLGSPGVLAALGGLAVVVVAVMAYVLWTGRRKIV